MDIQLLATFGILVGLELVLGIDNILLISILTGRLLPEQQAKARYIGLAMALVLRCVLLLGASALVKLNEPVLFSLSWKAIILISGGAFLLFKAVKEIHHVVETDTAGGAHSGSLKTSMASVVTQILLLDMVFSIDSVITAVGLTDHLLVIYSSVIVSFVLVLFFAPRIASFINAHPALKILALSFLVTIGVTLTVEGFGGHVPKGYIYLPMGFALIVELLQMRFTHNQKKTPHA